MMTHVTRFHSLNRRLLPAVLFLLLPLAGQGQTIIRGTGTFYPGADIAVTAKPYMVATADIDGDGDLDFLEPNFSTLAGAATSSVSIRLNNGSGTFTAAPDVAVGSQPRGLALGDIDGDGDPDLVTANYNSGTVSVRVNNGTGTFSGSVELAADTYPQSVALADLDNDGDRDVLCSNGGSNTVSIFLNNGFGTFTANQAVAVGPFPFSLTTGDIDGDGDIDLLTGDYDGNAVSVRLNNGNGTFNAGSNVTVGSKPRGIALGDLDGDGRLDLAVVNVTDNTLSLCYNTGTGSFARTMDIPTGNAPSSVALGDVNNDTFLDIVVSNLLDNTVEAYFSDGVGIFDPSSLVTVGTQPNRAALADLDGDGDLDLLAANFGAATISVRFNLDDLIVSSPYNVTGTYRNVTVTGPTTGGSGVGTLTGPLVVVGNMTILEGGTFHTACQPLTGPGTFRLDAGGTLGICDPAGIQSTGNQGAIQVATFRMFSNDASYIYNGTAAQVTGSALPAQVRNLTTTNASAVTLTAALTVARTLTVASSGNLVLNGKVLTLPSSATGTALAVNSGTGIVQGATALVQRYLDPTLNSGLGYHHYSAPVSGSTVADLTTPGFTPVVNPAYNTSASPGYVTPFPTVLAYDQARQLTASGVGLANPNFDKGWFSPEALSDALQVGRGYSVNLPASQKVDFAGTLNTGTLTMALAHNPGATDPDAGRALIGNPYPSPLNWELVQPADRANLDATIYVYESTSQYAGQFRAYTNGVGSGNPLIGSGQGFFVRVSTGQTSGSVTFRNSQRVTDYAQQVPVRRAQADTRPQLELQLQSPGGANDAVFVYAQPGATREMDPEFDAAKLSNSNGLNVSVLTPAGRPLAISGLAALPDGLELPLAVTVPTAGRYMFRLQQLSNLPTAQQVLLLDLATGRQVNLQQGSYTCALDPAAGAQALAHRFVLRIGKSTQILATTTALSAAVSVYPNPAHGSLTILVPAVAGVSAASASLRNSLGQVVRAQVAVTALGVPTTLDVSDLALGVYLLQLRVGETSIVKRIVLE